MWKELIVSIIYRKWKVFLLQQSFACVVIATVPFNGVASRDLLSNTYKQSDSYPKGDSKVVHGWKECQWEQTLEKRHPKRLRYSLVEALLVVHSPDTNQSPFMNIPVTFIVYSITVSSDFVEKLVPRFNTQHTIRTPKKWKFLPERKKQLSRQYKW